MDHRPICYLLKEAKTHKAVVVQGNGFGTDCVSATNEFFILTKVPTKIGNSGISHIVALSSHVLNGTFARVVFARRLKNRVTRV